MSVEEIKRFNGDVNKDESLKDEVMKIGTDVEKLITLAKGKGYDFTAEELTTVTSGKDEELSEEQLDTIAGGGALVTESVVVYQSVVIALN